MNDDEDMGSQEFVKELAKYKVNWRQGKLGANSKLFDDYAIEGFPTKVVVGKDGTVLFIDNFIEKSQLEQILAADH